MSLFHKDKFQRYGTATYILSFVYIFLGTVLTVLMLIPEVYTIGPLWVNLRNFFPLYLYIYFLAILNLVRANDIYNNRKPPYYIIFIFASTTLLFPCSTLLPIFGSSFSERFFNDAEISLLGLTFGLFSTVFVVIAELILLSYSLSLKTEELPKNKKYSYVFCLFLGILISYLLIFKLYKIQNLRQSDYLPSIGSLDYCIGQEEKCLIEKIKSRFFRDLRGNLYFQNYCWNRGCEEEITKLDGVDIDTFEIINGSSKYEDNIYFKDKSHVYILTRIYFLEDKNVQYCDASCGAVKYKFYILEDADPNTFVLDENHKFYSTDGHNFYYIHMKIPDVDPTSFRILTDGEHSKDKNNSYFRATIIKEEDLE